MSLPAIGFLAVERRHVGLEVAGGREGAARGQVAVTGEDGVCALSKSSPTAREDAPKEVL